MWREKIPHMKKDSQNKWFTFRTSNKISNEKATPTMSTNMQKISQ